MPILRRILVEKHFLITVVAVAIALDVAFHAFAVYPWTIKVSNAERRAISAQQSLATVQNAYTMARATLQDKAETDEELRNFYVDILPRDLAGARRITYPRLGALARQSNLLLKRRSSTPEKDEDSRLARLRTTMLLVGKWWDIRQFIYALEISPEFIVIEEIVVTQGTEVDSALALTLALSTFYWARDDSN